MFFYKSFWIDLYGIVNPIFWNVKQISTNRGSGKSRCLIENCKHILPSNAQLCCKHILPSNPQFYCLLELYGGNLCWPTTCMELLTWFLLITMKIPKPLKKLQNSRIVAWLWSLWCISWEHLKRIVPEKSPINYIWKQMHL